MMLSLTHRGKEVLVAFNAITYMRPRFLLGGAVIGIHGGDRIVVDQTPKNILAAIANANNAMNAEKDSKPPITRAK